MTNTIKANLVFGVLFFQLSDFTLAASIDETVAECIRQMKLGVCITKNTNSSSNLDSTILISGIGRVSNKAYSEYASKVNYNNPNDFSMCYLAGKYMKNSPGSDHDKIARALWSPRN